MKALWWVVGLAVLGIVIFFWSQKKMAEDVGAPILMAFGYPDSGKITMHMAVDLGMVNREGPRLTTGESLMWGEWVTDHFRMYGDTGTDIPLERQGQSLLINDRKVVGSVDFYLVAKVQAGIQYTLDYKPYRDEAKLYRFKFIAPEQERSMRREFFAIVEKP